MLYYIYNMRNALRCQRHVQTCSDMFSLCEDRSMTRKLAKMQLPQNNFSFALTKGHVQLLLLLLYCFVVVGVVVLLANSEIVQL